MSILNRLGSIYRGASAIIAQGNTPPPSPQVQEEERSEQKVQETYQRFRGHLQGNGLDFLVDRLPPAGHVQDMMFEEDGRFEVQLKQELTGQIIRKDMGDWEVPRTAVKVKELVRGRVTEEGVHFEEGIGGHLDAGLFKLSAKVEKVTVNKDSGQITIEARDTFIGIKVTQRFHPEEGHQPFFSGAFALDPKHVEIKYKNPE